MMPKRSDARRGRTIVGNSAHSQLQKDILKEDLADDSFSFLSEWASMNEKKIRW